MQSSGTRGQGWGLMETLPIIFDKLQYFEKIYLQWKAFDLLDMMKYILWALALLVACNVTKLGRYLGGHLGFYQELEMR